MKLSDIAARLECRLEGDPDLDIRGVASLDDARPDAIVLHPPTATHARIMEQAGLPAAHVKAIRGFADTILRTPDAPFNPRNRRVSIVVQNDTVQAMADARPAPAAAVAGAATAADTTRP